MTETLKRIPERHEIKAEDTWDLSRLFPSDEAWKEAFGKYEKMVEKVPAFRGTLAQSAESLADWMDYSCDLDILGQRLSVYSYLRHCEDQNCADALGMMNRHEMAEAKRQTAGAWEKPEILAIPDVDIAKMLEHPRLADYRVYIARILRLRPHTLTAEEEKVAALYEEGSGSLSEACWALLDDIDVDLGTIDTPDGEIELNKNVDWTPFFQSPDRNVRRKVYEKIRDNKESVKTTVASFLSGWVKQNAIRAKVREYPSVRASVLFRDNVDEKIYDNLIATANEHLLHVLHRYHAVRKRILGLDELRAYDLSMPQVSSVRRRTTWNEAVDIICDALSPLGVEYVSTLRNGLLGRWADRYANKGKSHNLSCHFAFGSEPYILMGYKEDNLQDVFNLAHEGGHAMHILYSARSNPFRQHEYSSFETEAASAFNEELLFRHMMKNAGDDRELRLFLVSKRLEDLLDNMMYSCILYAEFEHIVHKLEEEGVPLTHDVLNGEYRKLVAKYRGPDFVMDDSSGLRHLSFLLGCQPFSLYVYVTGICAAFALADRVLGGGESERNDYLAFLKSGGLRFPMDSLKLAGVDMSRPEPIQAACNVFSGLVDELERLL